MRQLPGGPVTLVFTDIEGSTRLLDALGDDYAAALDEHRRRLRTAAASHHGVEVDTQGDAFFFVFQHAADALAAAIAAQDALSAGPIRVRIGMHSGEPIKEGDKFFGKTLILAARIASQAAGEEIFVSQLVRDLLESTGEFTFDEGREATLKGLSGTYRLYGVKW